MRFDVNRSVDIWCQRILTLLRYILCRDDNMGQPAPVRPNPLLARQKRGGAGRANLRGWAQTHTRPA